MVSTALTAAVSGLRTAQVSMSLIAQNVANADNPNYTRKIASNETRVVGDQVIGVNSGSVQRTLDTLLQRSLRLEVSGGRYADVRAGYTDRLGALYGPPGTDAALDAVYNRFVGALEAVATSPENAVTRSRFIGEANVLTQRLNGLSDDIQTLRVEAEQGIGDAVSRLNDALGRLRELDRMIVAGSAGGRNPANLIDQRDGVIGEISGLVDIRVETRTDNSTSVFTRSGLLLYDREPVALSFDQRATLTPQALYDTNPAERSVGTISMLASNGKPIDLIAQDVFRSGEIAGLISLRDDLLPAAQSQLDEFAAGLTLALSRRDTPVLTNFTAPANATIAAAQPSIAPVAGGYGLSVPDLGATDPIQPGDRITLDLVVSGVSRRVTIVRQDSAAAPPGRLDDGTTPETGDIVIGAAWGGSLGAFATNATNALAALPEIGSGFTFAANAGPPRTLSVVGDGTSARVVNGLKAELTETRFLGGSAAAPIFTDAARSPPLFLDTVDGVPQRLGFAQRITVNAELANDTALLVRTGASSNLGDPIRPNGLLDRLNRTTRLFRQPEGPAGTGAPLSTTTSSFLQRIVADQGQQAELHKRLSEGQAIVVNNLQERFNTSSKVNVDEEMARLIELQQTYQASARILSAVDDMFRALLQI